MRIHGPLHVDSPCHLLMAAKGCAFAIPCIKVVCLSRFCSCLILFYLTTPFFESMLQSMHALPWRGSIKVPFSYH
ncbi:MAG: hypothetical protein JOS17DRAFT_749521 [Linnemannia elongata]|nr:MAG: hypothetical protein JOS17DRAFT_749521 [Linnemannia elongata]